MSGFVLLYPLQTGKSSKISQKFGQNLRPYSKLGNKGHSGQDYPVPVGTPVLAAADGEVSDLRETVEGPSKDPKAPWNYVRLRHPSGYETVYGHLQKDGVLVKKGDKVLAGQQIALSGNSGWSTGPHLHFGLRPIGKDGVRLYPDNGYKGYIDPLPFLEPAAFVPTIHPTELSIPVPVKLEGWQVDLMDYVRSKEDTNDYILKDVDGFVANMTPYHVLALVLHTNPKLNEEWADFVYKKYLPNP